MSSHLQDEALLDAVEHAGSDEARGHLRACPECASRVADLRRTLEAVRDAGVPEPPPAYWNTLRREIARQVGEGESPRTWARVGLWAPGLALAAGVLGVVLVMAPATSRTPRPAVPAWSAVPENEEAVMTALQGLEPSSEDLASVAGAGSIADEVAGLSDEERLELAQALRVEMKGGTL